jgi:membrane fusion protein, multidrug efflux system
MNGRDAKAEGAAGMPRGDGQIRTGATALYIGGLVIVVAAAAAAFTISQSRRSEIAAERIVRTAEAEKGPRVPVVAVTLSEKQRDIPLVGDVKPYQLATVYSKVNGYLKNITIDRGDRVQGGQVVAEIESVETDSQYLSAVADLDNKKKRAARDQEMASRGNVSRETAETSETNLRMAEANVRQLATLKSYEILRAPFAGMVTARFADPGQLIQNATTGQGNALPVLTIADTSRVRVACYVEQRDVPYVKVGSEAEVADGARPDRKFPAKVSRSTGTLDPKTRNLYIELDVDNADGTLVAGSFAQVTLHVPVQSYPQIPATALVVRSGQTFVAAVDDQGQIHFKPVRVASTSGAVINIAEGVAVGDRLAVSLPDDVGDGTRIQPMAVAEAQ